MYKYLLITIISAALLSACPRHNRSGRDGGAGKSGGERPLPQRARGGGELRVRLASEPPHLNLLIQPDHGIRRIAHHDIVESLFRIDPRKLTLEPELALSWKFSRGNRRLTIKLRQAVRWHDGRPFSAADVKFTIDAIFNPRVRAATARSALANLKSIKVLGAHEIQLDYREPLWISIYALAEIPILPRHVYSLGDLNRHPANSRPLGTGPFRFSRWTRGREIVVAKNRQYWGAKPYLNRIRYLIVRDNAVAVKLLKQGALDIIERLPPQQWRRLQKPGLARLPYRLLRAPQPGYTFRGYNLRHPIFRDRRIRLAMTLLTDRQTIIEKFRHGLNRPTAGHFFHKSPYHDRSLKPHPYSPKRAQALLDQAGWRRGADGKRRLEGRPLAFSWLLPTASASLLPEARFFKEDLKRQGIELRIVTVDWATFLSRIRAHRFDMIALQWRPGIHDDPYAIWHSSQAKGGANYISFADRAVDQILERARRTFDQAQRTRLYHRFEAILHRQQPYTFMYGACDLSVVARRVQGVYTSPLGLVFRDWWVGGR